MSLSADADPPPLAGWKTTLALAWILAHVLVPPAIVLIADHRPTVFAWQMFSRGTPRVQFTVLFRDGRVVVYEPGDLVLKDRGDIPFADLLPDRLCALEGAAAVRTETAHGERTQPCA